MTWINYPFARIAPLLIIGILFKELFGWVGWFQLILVLFILVLLLFYFFIFNIHYHANKNIFPTFAALLSRLIIG